MTDKIIKKFELDTLSDLTGYYACVCVGINKGGVVIDVSYEDDKIYIHAVVNPESKIKKRWFDIYEENMPAEQYDKKTCEYIGKLNTNPTRYIFEVHD